MKKLTVKSLKQFLFGSDKEKNAAKKSVTKIESKEPAKLNGKIIPYRRNRKPELL